MIKYRRSARTRRWVKWRRRRCRGELAGDGVDECGAELCGGGTIEGGLLGGILIITNKVIGPLSGKLVQKEITLQLTCSSPEKSCKNKVNTCTVSLEYSKLKFKNINNRALIDQTKEETHGNLQE
ncbi:hypothetical protein E3N88_00343 [Mikania micrantha]|uniref:Uncharacterized protein n=1 Tax=Mikania micrantha TaxID=192012 RepID=A0A5N6PZ93_9ASTR|nr:hypothetical protein E3N88_00343 [Mikania micrantha]